MKTSFKKTLPEIAAAQNVRIVLESAGRLDKILASQLSMQGISRARLQALIDLGQVQLNGQPCLNPSQKVKINDAIDLHIPAAETLDMPAQPMALEIAYEDADVIVINKPAGLVVHPAPGHRDQTLVNALLAHAGSSLSGIGGVKRPGIVHRLDKDTSGLMVVAKNDAAHQALAAQFKDRSLSRTYLALCHGIPKKAQGRIETAIGRDRAHRQRMTVVLSGKNAITDYAVEKTFGRVACLIRCTLQTGRTHQIRVHLKHIGHPIVGDPVYGSRQKSALPAFNRQALHAVGLKFIHPKTGQAIELITNIPKDMKNFIKTLEKAINEPHI